MADCCGSEVETLRERQGHVLIAVLAINTVLFVVEFGAGVFAGSTALLADSLDMLGDALVYGFSLYVIARDDLWKARAATLKGVIMAGFGVFVLGQALYKLAVPAVPNPTIIQGMALIALVANAVCLLLLWRHRGDDVNMRSVWVCSRNDIVANVAVIGAGVGVWWWQSQMPDILIGLAIAALFLKSSVGVLRDAAEVRADSRLAAPS
jgi:cation diffusion facilitator family transporter